MNDPKNPVNADCLFLVCDLVCRKMPRTVQTHLRKTGVDSISEEQYKAAVIGVNLHRRFLEGDYRASDNELISLKRCCQVINDIHQDNVELPRHAVEFDWGVLRGKEGELFEGAYSEVMHQVASGVLEGH